MSVVRHSPLIITVKLGTIHVRKLPLQRNSHCSAPDAPSFTINYAQFGNKTHKGFCFYPNARPAIEVTDTVFFDRQLQEWQCALE